MTRGADYVVLDTDVASRLQRGTLPADVLEYIRDRGIAVTFVTVGEFFKGAYERAWGPRRIAELERWLRNVVVLPYDAGEPEVGRGLSDQESARSGKRRLDCRLLPASRPPARDVEQEALRGHSGPRARAVGSCRSSIYRDDRLNIAEYGS